MSNGVSLAVWEIWVSDSKVWLLSQKLSLYIPAWGPPRQLSPFWRLSRVKQTLRFPGLPSAVLLRATHAPQVGFTLAACQGQAERRHTHTHTLTPLLNHTTLALHTVSIQLVVMVSSETRFLQSWSSLSIYSRVIVYCRWTHMHEHRPLCLISALCGCMCVHMLPLCPTFCFVCQDVCVGVKV